MSIDGLIDSSGAEIALANKSIHHARWVRSKAREVDISDSYEYSLVLKLSHIMKAFIEKYEWAAASSNNIFWRETETPVRMITAPLYSGEEKQMITLVNPKIAGHSIKAEKQLECCGSLGRPLFYVERHKGIRISGFVLEENRQVTYNLGTKEANDFQHEIDHISAELICDKGEYIGMRDFDRLKGISTLNGNALMKLHCDTILLALKPRKKGMVWEECKNRKEDYGYGKPIVFRVPLEEYRQNIFR
jgi:peptide deformylase